MLEVDILHTGKVESGLKKSCLLHIRAGKYDPLHIGTGKGGVAKGPIGKIKAREIVLLGKEPIGALNRDEEHVLSLVALLLC